MRDAQHEKGIIVADWTQEQIDTLQKEYERLLPILEAAATRLSANLQRVTVGIQDRELVRVRIRPIRTKELDSIRRKFENKGLGAGDSIFNCGDLIGARVVCNNVADVYRFLELLREQAGIEILDVEDYIKKPRDDGYRALHVNGAIEWMKQVMQTNRVPCEIQIRTLLQDSWAELSHDDIYKKGSDLPLDLRERLVDLARIVANADDIAQRIRTRITQEVEIKGKLDRKSVSKAGLALIFRDAFGRAPSDYGMQKAINACKDSNVTLMEAVSAILLKPEFRDKVRIAYQESSGFNVDPSNEDILVSAIKAVAKDEQYALRQVRRRGRADRAEVESAWRREVLSELPESADELVSAVNDGSMSEWSMQNISDAFGALNRCDRCGTPILDEYGFIEGLSQHYNTEIEYDDLSEFFTSHELQEHYKFNGLCAACGNDYAKLMNE